MKIVNKVKSFYHRVAHDWEKSPKLNKRLFVGFLIIILLAFIVGVTFTYVGSAKPLFAEVFQGSDDDSGMDGQGFTGVKRLFGGRTKVTIPVNDEGNMKGRVITSSYVVFDTSEGGDSCYKPGAAQTFCFRSESYTSDSEWIMSNSLRFPSGWKVSNVNISGTPTCDNGTFGSLTWEYGPSPNEVTINHVRQQSGNDHCVATYCVDVMPEASDNPAQISWYFEGDSFGSPPHDTCSSDGYYSCDQASLPPAEVSTCRWQQIASDPIERMDGVLASYKAKVWSITGFGDNGVSFYAPVTKTWTEVADSDPPFGNNLARTGCHIGSKVFVYGDTYTSGFERLWSYDMDTNIWAEESPSGIPPSESGIYAPAWVADEDLGLCYLTGGATEPGGGNLKSVYVYDAGADAWLAPLADFTSVRDFHAAFLFERPSDDHKQLCVAGGVNESDVALKSTQCYDFDIVSWSAENSVLRVLPDYWWGMGYAQISTILGEQLWMVAGEIGGEISDHTMFYDVPNNEWVSAGPLETGAVYRTSAVSLYGIVYHVGGSVEGFDYTGLADKCHVEWYYLFPLVFH